MYELPLATQAAALELYLRVGGVDRPRAAAFLAHLGLAAPPDVPDVPGGREEAAAGPLSPQAWLALVTAAARPREEALRRVFVRLGAVEAAGPPAGLWLLREDVRALWRRWPGDKPPPWPIAEAVEQTFRGERAVDWAFFLARVEGELARVQRALEGGAYSMDPRRLPTFTAPEDAPPVWCLLLAALPETEAVFETLGRPDTRPFLRSVGMIEAALRGLVERAAAAAAHSRGAAAAAAARESLPPPRYLEPKRPAGEIATAIVARAKARRLLDELRRSAIPIHRLEYFARIDHEGAAPAEVDYLHEALELCSSSGDSDALERPAGRPARAVTERHARATLQDALRGRRPGRRTPPRGLRLGGLFGPSASAEVHQATFDRLSRPLCDPRSFTIRRHPRRFDTRDGRSHPSAAGEDPRATSPPTVVATATATATPPEGGSAAASVEGRPPLLVPRTPASPHPDRGGRPPAARRPRHRRAGGAAASSSRGRRSPGRASSSPRSSPRRASRGVGEEAVEWRPPRPPATRTRPPLGPTRNRRGAGRADRVVAAREPLASRVSSSSSRISSSSRSLLGLLKSRILSIASDGSSVLPGEARHA